MISTSNSLRRAVHCVLLASAASAVTAVPAVAQETDSAARPIEEVVITGSRIRRVDEETASPVFVMDSSTIANTGVKTMGDLMMRVPAISGAATNPQVNNGGGTGESNVELRGLGAQRTLVLLNGRRLNILGNTTTSAVDVNMIPINMIERVEVLKEGAGAVYGSDAIAGVVNFITKKNYEGAEVSVEYGQTGESDGESQTASLTLGSTGEKLSVLFGARYSKQDPVSAADRAFSANALYLYGGVVTAAGSSRTPNGFISIGDSAFSGNFLEDGEECGVVSRNPGAAGTSPTASDYHCFGGSDLYNYQPFNLLITPQERSSVFTMLNYKLGETTEAYGEVLYNRTRSGFELAPLPFDANADDIIISANNAYNPFGIDFGGVLVGGPAFRTRMEALGNRASTVDTDDILANAGVRGDVGTSTWKWDAGVQVGRKNQDSNISGYILRSDLQNAVGPTTMVDGVLRCGTADNIIAGCTPINLFNIQDPAQIAALQSISTNYRTEYSYESSGATLNANGELFDLPAGPVLMAVGGEYRTQEGQFEVDVLTRGEPPLFLSCLLAQETCSGDSYAKYNVRELYTEFLVPILKDMPGAQQLNISAGVRYSDYSKDSIGDSTNAQFRVEYRPISDLLVRASYAEVFRAPTIVDLSLAPTQDSPTFADPCTNLTPAMVAANPNLAIACQGVPQTGDFTQPNSQVTGLITGQPNLKPETGEVMTAGFVYDPNFVEGLSFTADYWTYKIEDLITQLDPNFASTQCVNTGNPAFCGLIHRYPEGTAVAGEIQVFEEPIVNLGKLETDGVDIGVKYSLRDTPAGTFNISLDVTRILSYESTPAPGAAPIEIAGTFDRQFGNYAKWRGLMGIGWAMGGFDGLLSVRYIHSLQVNDPDGLIENAPPLQIGSMTYIDASIGYTFPTDTKIQFGGINLNDKQPPLLYQNNVINANTDVSTYDLLGRRWFVGVTQKF
ncbi:TonB-dependent receptor [Steroidobacter agaridevorans]|uniref:TonB-dependent receptor n=1 Tax=Steroidobacter agaridevorans TaxID=2695856 RepID=A0A829Y6Z8_9GAMM|nr:TonB-dependent receptor [Steroidobacter agaridevorans]GFE78997.1 TonB-dependent receptor [Steroidobacter agaridevorans]GFE88152.1 TonB-dependent receptor [Steroidobacter agaridevorans]